MGCKRMLLDGVIKEETEFGPAVIALLQTHLDSMAALSPAESVHALDISSLQRSDVTFWCLWSGELLAGCGALLELDPTHGEIKSMRTDQSFLRRGVAALLLEQIIATAQQRNYIRLSLETGSDHAFQPAHALYTRFGFTESPPFANYVLDPYSRFMTLELR